MKLLIITAAVVLFSTTTNAQINNAKIETVKVYGDCGMCKTTIEKAASVKKVSKAEWNEDTKMATITYDSEKTNIDAVLKNIALAGYDNEKFLAPDETYNKLAGCCKYERESKAIAKVDHSKMEKKHDDHAGHDHTAMAKTTDTTKQPNAHAGDDMQMQSNDKKEPNHLQSVFENYFSVKDALVKSDGAAASAKASTLSSALNAIKMENLKTDEHVAWMEWEKNLKTHVQSIGKSKDLAKQRESFSSLSKGMYVLIKSTKSPSTVYWQNCPMYNDGKGANWLSKESAVKNPYYGSMMLTCGKTVETVK